MAKKAELLEEAKKLKLSVTPQNTIAEIESAIKAAGETPVTELSDEEKNAGKALVAKAGKRSEKALHEAEEHADKEARKVSHDTTPQSDEVVAHTKRGPAPKIRPHHERKGKKYRAVYAKIEQGKSYNLADALKLAVETNPASFDASVEAHVVLGVDPRQADQNIRATVSLPHGTGKTIRVAAFVPADEAEAAKKAGADIAGEDAVMALLDKEKLDFDILIATPQLMPKLGKYARLLGPRGMMPNPKSGTVSTNVAKAVKEAKGGKVEYRVDKQSIVHLSVGKVSFGDAKLADNATAFFASLQSVKPSSIKGIYIESVHVTTTMGPGIKVDPSSVA
ncbi:MAG: 50S ribosomal protein L1 [Candidatus Saccharimonadales bacterium]